MTPKEKVLKELQEFHECFYDESKSNTAELKRKRIEEYIEKSYQAIYELNEEKLAVMDELESLKRYPTQEEVCEALSEYLGYNVIYGTHYTFVGENEICWFEHGRVVFNIYDLPPHLIIKIGRFYEKLK